MQTVRQRTHAILAAVTLLLAPAAQAVASDHRTHPVIVLAQATAPAPPPRPGRTAATAPVTVEPFAPAQDEGRRDAAAAQPKAAGAPLPPPRPARAAKAKAGPALTAARPGGTTARSVRAAATIPAALKRDEISLLGVFGGADTRRALLRKPTGATQRVRQGDRVDAWTVSAIGPESVQLRSGSRTQTLRVP